MRRISQLIALGLASTLVVVAAAAASSQRHPSTYEFLYTTSAASGAHVWRARFVTTSGGWRLMSPVPVAAVPGARGLAALTAVRSDSVVDRYSGDLIAARNGTLTATDPRAHATVSVLDLPAPLRSRSRCGQVSTDNHGALIVACGRAIVLIRLTPSRRLDSPGTSVTVGRLPARVSAIAPTFVSRKAAPARCRRHCTRPVFTG